MKKDKNKTVLQHLADWIADKNAAKKNFKVSYSKKIFVIEVLPKPRRQTI